MTGPDSIKYFFSNFYPTYIPETNRGAWNQTDGVLSRRLVLDRDENGVSNYRAIGEDSTSNPFDFLITTCVSEPLEGEFHFSAGVLIDTVTIVIGAKENSDLGEYYLHYYIYVTEGDSDIVRGVLLDDTISSTELTVTEGGREFSGNLSSLTAEIGDRIVIEVGAQGRNDSDVFRYVTVYFGNTGADDLTTDGTSYVTTSPGTFTFTGTAEPYSYSSSSSSSESSSSVSSSSESSSSSETRYIFKYFLSNVSAGYVPSIKGNWEDIMHCVNKKLVKNRIENGVSGDNTISMCGSDQERYRVLFGRFVSDGIPTDVDFNGVYPYNNNVRIVAGAKEDNITVNSHLYYYMYVTIGDSDNIRGVIFNNLENSNELTTNAMGSEYDNNFTGFSALADDRVVLEIGFDIKYGPDFPTYNDIVLYYGGISDTDLIEGGTIYDYDDDTTFPGTVVFE